ncbi:hypothetical protein Tco_0643719 [Tanacetum coccineum]
MGDLKEIPKKLENFTSTISSLTSQVVELKNIQWELPVKFLDLPSQVSSVQEKLKTLDSLPSLLNKSCGKGAHYGYNCPPQIPIISNPEPCYNQNLNEILQNLQSLQQQCLLGTCQQCGCNEYDGVCFYCTVGNGTPINFSTPYSSNDSPSFANHPPQPQYVPYSCELCGNDSHYGYDCPPQVPFVYNQDPCFNQNFDYFPQTSPSFPQQYPCCEDCGGPHETFQCQPMNEDYYHEQNSCYDSNSFGFDQTQPPQYTVNHPIFNVQNDLLNSQNKLMEQMTSICDMVGQIMQKKEEEKRIAEEQAAKNRYWKIPICYDDDEDYTIAITPVLSTKKPEDSLIMGDEHLNTIPETESDEIIKSSVENLVPIPSESEDFSENESECDMPVCDDFITFSNPLFDSNEDFTSSDDESLSDEDVPMENFKIYSNPLFDDEEIISPKNDPHYFNAESNLIESLLNRDILIDSSPKFDYLLEEFYDPIPPGIKKADFDLEEEIRLVENLLYDNSSPRPPEELNLEIADTILESLSPSPIPVADSDSLMEEIDVFLTSDDSMPPGIENDDYDSEGDIYFLEELLSNDFPPLLENESSNLDHFNDPSSPRPPPEPPSSKNDIHSLHVAPES